MGQFLLVPALLASQVTAAPRRGLEADTVLAEALDRVAAHGAWLDRAQALQKAAADAEYLSYRAKCWSVESPQTAWIGRLSEHANAVAARHAQLDRTVRQLGQAMAGPPPVIAAADGGVASAPSPSLEDLRRTVEESSRALEVLERTQLALEQELLQPRPPREALLEEVLEDPARADACVELGKAWAKKLAGNAQARPELAQLAPVLDLRIRNVFLDGAAYGDIFAGNNAGLPSWLSNQVGVAERFAGVETLALGANATFGPERNTTAGSGTITFNPHPTGRGKTVSTARDNPWQPFVRLQVPLSSTGVDHPLQGSARGTLAFPFGLTLGSDHGDFTDPRRSGRRGCFSSVETLTPFLGAPSAASGEQLSVQRAPLYARCVQRGLSGARLGLRASAQILTGLGPGRSAIEPGVIALGVLVQPHPVLTAQVGWRATGWPDSRHELVSAVRVGSGLGASRFGTDYLLRLDLDTVLALDLERRDVPCADGSTPCPSSPERPLRWLLAPSIQLRLTRQLFTTLSVGYLRGYAASGVWTSAGLTLNADALLGYPIPPSSL